MQFPIDFNDFKESFPELIVAAQGIGSEAFNSEKKFDQSVLEYNSLNCEDQVINAFANSSQATALQASQAKFANLLGVASIFAGYVRQINVENEFVPGYDGSDSGNNDANLQGLANTMFNALFAQNSYGRKFLNIIYRGGVPLGLVAM